MDVVNFRDRTCNKMRGYFDSYLDNELIVETNHELLRHIESCDECARLLEERARIKKTVKSAVLKEQPPAELLANIQKTIRESDRAGGFHAGLSRWSLALAALLILAAAGLFTWQTIRTSKINQIGVVESISAEARELLKIGLADHVHCTLELGKWKELISFEHMKEATGRAALGPQFIDLVPITTEKLGPDFQFIQGHRCTINGRDYIHLITTGQNGAILSLVITEKKQDEAFTTVGARAASEISGVPIYRDNQEQLEIAGFETGRFLVFVVSNLNASMNLSVASNLAPSVYQFLRRIEA
jgi:hypothetical protein